MSKWALMGHTNYFIRFTTQHLIWKFRQPEKLPFLNIVILHNSMKKIFFLIVIRSRLNENN